MLALAGKATNPGKQNKTIKTKKLAEKRAKTSTNWQIERQTQDTGASNEGNQKRRAKNKDSKCEVRQGTRGNLQNKTGNAE